MATSELPQSPGYRLEKILGKGAMATVYLAIQESLDRRVAIKVLPAHLGNDPIFSKRFVKEGKTVARLAHPHIVTIYDTGSHQQQLYIAME